MMETVSITPLAEAKFQGIEKSIAICKSEDPQIIHGIRATEQKIRDLRKTIANEAKKNFELEQSIGDIDDKIKLLIANRMAVEEVMATTKALKSGKKAGDAETSPIKGKVASYEDLFYLLQTRPTYFAQLARLVQGKDAPLFVKTVVFDMYGDQYDSREERLLLALFQRAIKDEIEDTPNKGSLFRANTATTQMLSSYAKRGSGLAILKELLQEPLQTLTKKTNLNLEISPVVVYNELIKKYETETGQVSPLPTHGIDDETASKNPDTQKTVDLRAKMLVEETDIFLQRILNGVDKIPFGMRWICKQLGVMSKAKFPDADAYQIGSLIGGNIFLRFFCPAIITPDAINFITTKPSKIMRKNLILIVKMLQAMSNSIPFGGKEQFMTVNNWYLDKNRDNLQKYFEQLIQVEELEDAHQEVDKYLEHTNMGNSVTLSLNQIFLIHRLVYTHLDKLAPLETSDKTDMQYKDDMKLRQLLTELGPPPAQQQANNRADDREVILSICERAQKSNMRKHGSVAGEFQPSPESLKKEQLKNIMVEVLGQANFTESSCSNDVMEFLAQQEKVCQAAGNTELATKMSNLIKMMEICKAEMIPKDTDTDTFNHFLAMVTEEVSQRQTMKARLDRRFNVVQSASDTITSHHTYLQERIELYHEYLKNVRKGRGNTEAATDKSKKKKKKEKLKIPHPEMVEKQYIMWVDEDLTKKYPRLLKKIVYVFEEKEPGTYQVSITLKKGVELPVANMGDPLELTLDNLLSMQESGTREYCYRDLMRLNVNLLINLLNKHFVMKDLQKNLNLG